jgi:pimeloyl-ACP methyl ester carboxylesterase
MQVKRLALWRMVCGAAALLAICPAIASAADLPAIPEGWSEGYVYANGIRIHYYHAVPAPGKPVILAIHGVMDTGLTWASVATRLQKDYDIYMLDTRGHGLSDPFTAADDRNTMIKDVVEAAQKLGLQKPVLMGHSMGGATVIRLGAEYPDLARAIIVVDAGISAARPAAGRAAGGPQPPAPQAAAAPAAAPAAATPAAAPTPPAATRVATAPAATPPAARPPAMAVNMRGTPEAMVAQNNYKFDDLVAKAHRDNPRWSMMDCQYWAVSIKQYHGPYTDALWQAMSGSMQTGDGLSKIEVPMIILKADASADAREAQQRAASVMKNGKLVHIDNSAHNVQRDQPESAEVIREFMTTRVLNVNTPG